MSQPPFIFQPRKAPRRRAKQTQPNAGLLITSVELQTYTSSLTIRFSGPIAWNGVDVPQAFETTTEDGPDQGCVNVLGSGPDWITVEFNSGVEVGAPWQVTGPMAGITPAIAWPQSGTVAA